MARETPGQAEGTSQVVRPPLDDSPLSELLAQEPSRVTRRFLYCLAAVFLAALAASALLEIDVTITAPATLQPAGKGLLIQPEIDGTISEVLVQEGDPVHAGQVL